MTNAKKNTQSNETPNIVLKTVINDICRENPDHVWNNATYDVSKRVRVWLRANMRDIHEHNSSWIFTKSQYDVVRSHFDAKYKLKCERDAKRNAKKNDATSNATPRKRNAKKNDATSIDATQSNDETQSIDA
jgi:hypothetical protein